MMITVFYILHTVMGDRQYAYQSGNKDPLSRFDNYKWHGPHLAHLPYFEYCDSGNQRARRGNGQGSGRVGEMS